MPSSEFSESTDNPGLPLSNSFIGSRMLNFKMKEFFMFIKWHILLTGMTLTFAFFSHDIEESI